MPPPRVTTRDRRVCPLRSRPQRRREEEWMYREVRMTEVKEVLRLWLTRTGKKRIAAQLGIDVKTVRRYARAAASRWDCATGRQRGRSPTKGWLPASTAPRSAGVRVTSALYAEQTGAGARTLRGGRDQRGHARGDGAAGGAAAVPPAQGDRGAHLCGARMETRAQAVSSPRAPRQCAGVQPALHRPQSEVGAASEPIRARIRFYASPAALVAPTDHMGAETHHFATGHRQPSTLGGLIQFASR